MILPTSWRQEFLGDRVIQPKALVEKEPGPQASLFNHDRFRYSI